MKIRSKDIVIGIALAVIIATFINYTAIERIIDADKAPNAMIVNHLIFSVLWYVIISMLYYLLFVVSMNQESKRGHSLRVGVLVLLGAVAVTYAFVELYPWMRDLDMPHRRGGVARRIVEYRGISPVLFKHVLVCILNLLFVYIQKLLYRNQQIERHNEQLQMESLKSQHTALIQQINPHFFFNSLNSLRYIIAKSETERALDFLDNLTTIFRKTLKLSNSNQHSLSEEMEITTSYLHIINRRFEGKIKIDIQISEEYVSYMIPPLSLLTLIENVAKHNKISATTPLELKIYTTEQAEIAVENAIHPKFESVESNGLGLKNLNSQYELITGKGILIENDGVIFRVTMPLIKV